MICVWCRLDILRNEAYVTQPPGWQDVNPTVLHLRCFNNTADPRSSILAARTVKATREGLVGRQTATGHVIQADSWFVALPSTRALRRVVEVWNCSARDRRLIIAPVLDVGPWEEHDDAYVFGAAMPKAELGVDSRGRKTNHAGIDLSDAVWHALAMPDNGPVRWRFIEGMVIHGTI